MIRVLDKFQTLVFICIINYVSGWGCIKPWVPGENGHCYFFSSDTQTWYRATFTCEILGGHLAILRKNEELESLKGYAKSRNKGSFWVAGNNLKSIGEWRWHPTSEPIDMQALDWVPNELKTKNQCLSLENADCNVNTIPCDMNLHYICERYPGSDRLCTCSPKK